MLVEWTNQDYLQNHEFFFSLEQRSKGSEVALSNKVMLTPSPPHMPRSLIMIVWVKEGVWPSSKEGL